jgi:hypothetical protein
MYKTKKYIKSIISVLLSSGIAFCNMYSLKNEVLATDEGTNTQDGTTTNGVKVNEISYRWDAQRGGAWIITPNLLNITIGILSCYPERDFYRSVQVKGQKKYHWLLCTGEMEGSLYPCIYLCAWRSLLLDGREIFTPRPLKGNEMEIGDPNQDICDKLVPIPKDGKGAYWLKPSEESIQLQIKDEIWISEKDPDLYNQFRWNKVSHTEGSTETPIDKVAVPWDGKETLEIDGEQWTRPSLENTLALPTYLDASLFDFVATKEDLKKQQILKDDQTAGMIFISKITLTATVNDIGSGMKKLIFKACSEDALEIDSITMSVNLCNDTTEKILSPNVEIGKYCSIDSKKIITITSPKPTETIISYQLPASETKDLDTVIFTFHKGDWENSKLEIIETKSKSAVRVKNKHKK